MDHNGPVVGHQHTITAVEAEAEADSKKPVSSVSDSTSEGAGGSSIANGEDETPIFIIVMGVAGTGKTTLAHALNAELGMPYVEGDDLHPKSNIDKMSRGQPLEDADRFPWLHVVRREAERVVKSQIAEEEDAETRRAKGKLPRRKGVMVTCSSLKRSYRAILRGAEAEERLGSDADGEEPTTRLPTYFVYIKEDVPVLRDRIANRQNHFMKAGMLDSQLATLESPEGEEGVVVVPLNATTDEQVKKALEGLESLVGPLRW
ncbi:hypothetical protein EIP91_011239 [Steccherinum ochraceum]|uniref:Gluconokinase n=1 Tax=Steccherinum ochraceum TaxID=92696 RepID=A0A4R0RML6_9APHY|nr:hypothetical protein EIP91_011239 [Steccherinum ochraceum]